MNGSSFELLAHRLDELAEAARPDHAAPLRSAERAALAALARHGVLPLKEVALAAGIAKSTASGLIDGLVAQGLVHRERDGADGRRLALRLTPSGAAQLASAPLLDRRRIEAAVSALSAADQAELERLLALVAAGVRTAQRQEVVGDAGTVPGAAAGSPLPVSPAAEPSRPDGRAPGSPAAGGPLRVVICLIGGETYALPLPSVVEVLPYGAPRHAAAAGDGRAGLIPTRDGHLPVSELGRLLGVASASLPGSIVVVDGPAGREGLAVDRVTGLSTADAGSVAPPPGGATGVTGVVELDGRLVLLLDTALLLSR